MCFMLQHKQQFEKMQLADGGWSDGKELDVGWDLAHDLIWEKMHTGCCRKQVV